MTDHALRQQSYIHTDIGVLCAIPSYPSRIPAASVGSVQKQWFSTTYTEERMGLWYLAVVAAYRLAVFA
jgi:hypothetical protein